VAFGRNWEPEERPRPQFSPPSQLHSVSLASAASDVRMHVNQGRSRSVTKMTLQPGYERFATHPFASAKRNSPDVIWARTAEPARSFQSSVQSATDGGRVTSNTSNAIAAMKSAASVPTTKRSAVTLQETVGLAARFRIASDKGPAAATILESSGRPTLPRAFHGRPLELVTLGVERDDGPGRRALDWHEE
jgi:hypothetical protein